MIKKILLVIGMWFTNPVIPDLGIQFAAAFSIGLLLPTTIVNPVNRVLIKFRPIRIFHDKLSKRERLRTIVPRIIVGYALTYAIGGTCLLLWWIL